MPPAPRFTVIVVHYQEVNPHPIFMRGINSILSQTYKDFEVLVYHDGPLLDPTVEFPVPVICTETRYNDWGHSLRDLGLRRAKGEYILHFNADNLLYPNALEEISKAIDREPRIYDKKTHRSRDPNDIIVYAIWTHGMQRYGETLVRYGDHPEYCLLLTGNPPRLHFIDAMQLIMRRELWIAEGGWFDRSVASDGHMYQMFAAKYGYRSVEMILGEHF